MTIIPMIARKPASVYFLGVLIFATIILVSIPVLARASPAVKPWVIPSTMCKANNNCTEVCGVGNTMTEAAQNYIQNANSFDTSSGLTEVFGCGTPGWGYFLGGRRNDDISGKCGLPVLQPYDKSVAVRIGLCDIRRSSGHLFQPQVYQVVQCPPGSVPLPLPSPDNPSCSGAETYSITLSGFGSTEPGAILNGLRVKVSKDNRPAPGVQVQMTVDAIARSGGHGHHDAGRPKGALSIYTGATGTDGALAFTFTAPAPAGDHVITARCVDRDCGQATGTVEVGIKGLVPLNASPEYELIGTTNSHPGNHYLSDTALYRVTILAALYRGYLQRIQPPPAEDLKLHLNDASLERGGVFDIRDTWTRPHAEHCKGTAIDVRANDAPGAIPGGLRNLFEKYAHVVGADPYWDIPFVKGKRRWELRHYHVRLLGQESSTCPN